ncbi:MAG: hypothetical protein ACD_40C00018G0010 [uncultured bacterium]|nr:MAG: hypothetical protein ACD_40C00018G0010 [uncultured bacterium]KKU14557.1 MAG: hypothetical protein UX21_C0015G0006 [Microgenomates group bacterium GW2011_GWC2_45_8]KKU25826.1 MAG: hypothetical protein UX37_C0011G0012 [Microgenomates group bacterium GW2011_GWA2_46_16]
MKHDPSVTASAAATMVAVLYVVCRLGVWLLPELSRTIMQSWFHGLQIQPVAAWSLTFPAFLLGLVTATASAWLVGWCFAHCYNMFDHKSK